MKNWKMLLWAGIFLILSSAALDAAWWDDSRDIKAAWQPMDFAVAAFFGLLLVGGIVAIVMALRYRAKLKSPKPISAKGSATLIWVGIVLAVCGTGLSAFHAVYWAESQDSGAGRIAVIIAMSILMTAGITAIILGCVKRSKAKKNANPQNSLAEQ